MSNVDSVRNSSSSIDVALQSGDVGQSPSATDTMAVGSGKSGSGTQSAVEPQNSPADYAQTSLQQTTLDYGKLLEGNNGRSGSATTVVGGGTGSAGNVGDSPYNRENPSSGHGGACGAEAVGTGAGGAEAGGTGASGAEACALDGMGFRACATEIW